ncbi:MAG TPA: hypothetical protein VIZ28_02685 [Chitinophagaceae bacterium]
MKSTAKPSLYFSTYPLKAIKEPSATNKQPDSPYLRALLSDNKPKPSSSQGRVLSLISAHKRQFTPQSFETTKLSKDIEPAQKDWFKNYE